MLVAKWLVALTLVVCPAFLTGCATQQVANATPAPTVAQENTAHIFHTYTVTKQFGEYSTEYIATDVDGKQFYFTLDEVDGYIGIKAVGTVVTAEFTPQQYKDMDGVVAVHVL